MAEHGDRLSLGLTVLALLRELQVPATLFVISGHLDRGDPAYLAQALADGHAIGHHIHADSVSARLSPAASRASPGTPSTRRLPGWPGSCSATPIPARFLCCTINPTPCRPRSSYCGAWCPPCVNAATGS
ncbi:hypothetical protein NZK33_07020 [Cyanobium sp. FGCU-6]|nr:hypothetical protein [Cyanobium sp. FGCU6]